MAYPPFQPSVSSYQTPSPSLMYSAYPPSSGVPSIPSVQPSLSAPSYTSQSTRPQVPPYALSRKQYARSDTDLRDQQDPSLCMSERTANDALERAVQSHLWNAGFDGATRPAVERLREEVVAFIKELFARSHDYADIACRASPSLRDAASACADFSILPVDLHNSTRPKKRRRSPLNDARPVPPTLTPPPPRTPSPELLLSDDETVGPSIVNLPTTLRSLPNHLPPLPPKHTYLRTPLSSSSGGTSEAMSTSAANSNEAMLTHARAGSSHYPGVHHQKPYPPQTNSHPHPAAVGGRRAAMTLDKKLKNAALVQASLKNLLLATDDTAGQEDGELLGYVINCDLAMTSGTRKRWKVGTAASSSFDVSTI